MELLQNIKLHNKELYVFKYNNPVYDNICYKLYTKFYTKLWRNYDKSFHKLSSIKVDNTLKILNYIRHKRINLELNGYDTILAIYNGFYTEYCLIYYDFNVNKFVNMGTMFIIPGKLTYIDKLKKLGY